MNLSNKKIIDLSYMISNDMGIYPGDPNIKISEACKIPQDKVNILKIEIATHHGTHIDAPKHQITNGKTLDSYPINKFINQALKIDLTNSKKGNNKKENIAYHQMITKEDLEPYSDKIKQKKAIVLQTGYGQVIKNKNIDLNYPYLTEQAAQFLSNFNLNIIGIDSLTIDAPNKNTAHKILLSKDILLLETMINLEKLPDEFLLLCFPLLIKNSDGAPCRALAVCDK